VAEVEDSAMVSTGCAGGECGAVVCSGGAGGDPEVQRHVAEVEDYGGLTERVCNTHFLQD
jgi:hypothetical protein